MGLAQNLTVGLLIAPVAFVATVVATSMLLRVLRRREILDTPTDRSSHTVSTPRGGGVAIVGVAVPCMTAFAFLADSPPTELWYMIAIAGLLAVLSWFDDVHNLRVRDRLFAQISAVVLGLLVFEGQGPVFQNLLPHTADIWLTGIAWFCYINLFNFMDGIDGNAGGKSISLGIGLVALSLAATGSAVVGGLGMILAACAAGFLVLNWHPAKIFMGDVGSVPLGFLFGWLLLHTAANGLGAAALILIGYYLADNILTMVPRVFRVRRFWEPHREHIYQQAAVRGIKHSRIVTAILIGNVPLIALAVYVDRQPIYTTVLSLVLAVITVGITIAYIRLLRPLNGGKAME